MSEQLTSILRQWAEEMIEEADASHSSGHNSPAVRGQEYAMRSMGRSLIRLLDDHSPIDGPCKPSESLEPSRDTSTPLEAPSPSDGAPEALVATKDTSQLLLLEGETLMEAIASNSNEVEHILKHKLIPYDRSELGHALWRRARLMRKASTPAAGVYIWLAQELLDGMVEEVSL